METKALFVKALLTLAGWIVGVMVAYGAIKQDIAVLKTQQADDRHYIELRLDSIDRKLDTLGGKR